MDLLTDIQLQQNMVSCSDFMCQLNIESSRMNQTMSKLDEDKVIMVHSGFLRAYSSIRSTLLQQIVSSSDIDTIWMTGHSLGGALATIAVVDVGSAINSQSFVKATTVRKNDVTFSIPKKLTISSYVYGAPRVGNAAFARRLSILQKPNQLTGRTVIQNYYRVNAVGDAIVFLPRGKNINRLGIDYVHAGSTVILPSILNSKDTLHRSETANYMVQLEESLVERINNYILKSDGDITAANGKDSYEDKQVLLNNIKVYQKGDVEPDPLAEIDPDFNGIFPLNPLIWTTKPFQKFSLGEAVGSFRILRGGFNKEHQISNYNYEKILCSVSQENVVTFDVE